MYTLGFRRRIAHSGLHAETGGVSDGGGITTLGAFRTFTNIPGPGIRTASFAAFGPWLGVLQKDAESLRDSDALMRVAVPRRRGPAGLRNAAALASICFEVVISGGGGDRRENVSAPDRADIGLTAAQLSAEIGDGIRHDLQGIRAVPAPHGGKQIFLGKRDPRIAGEKQQHIELDPGQRQCGSVLKRLLGSSVNGQLREGKRVPETEGDPLCGDVLPPQQGQDLFLQLPLCPICLNDDHGVPVCYSASSSWSRLTMSHRCLWPPQLGIRWIRPAYRSCAVLP